MDSHLFIDSIQKIDVTTRCKMLEVKNYQHLSCGKEQFPHVYPQPVVENFSLNKAKNLMLKKLRKSVLNQLF